MYFFSLLQSTTTNCLFLFLTSVISGLRLHFSNNTGTSFNTFELCGSSGKWQYPQNMFCKPYACSLRDEVFLFFALIKLVRTFCIFCQWCTTSVSAVSPPPPGSKKWKENTFASFNHILADCKSMMNGRNKNWCQSGTVWGKMHKLQV